MIVPSACSIGATIMSPSFKVCTPGSVLNHSQRIVWLVVAIAHRQSLISQLIPEFAFIRQVISRHYRDYHFGVRNSLDWAGQLKVVWIHHLGFD